MGLTYKSRTIADAKVLDIFGVQGVGCYQLNFSLEFNLPNWEPADGKAVLGNLRADIAVGANRENLKRIGYALPETPLPLETKEITQRQCIQFLLNLSEQQLFALEALRNGGGLYFRVTVSGEARGEEIASGPARIFFMRPLLVIGLGYCSNSITRISWLLVLNCQKRN